MTFFSNAGYTASNKRVISELRIEKDLEGNGRELILGNFPEVVWRDGGKTTKKLQLE
jgi:hypothetical protein